MQLNLGLNQSVLVEAVLAGLIWYVCYLYVRRYLNPENNSDVEKYKEDAKYGAFAAAAAVVLKDMVKNNIRLG